MENTQLVWNTDFLEKINAIAKNNGIGLHLRKENNSIVIFSNNPKAFKIGEYINVVVPSNDGKKEGELKVYNAGDKAKLEFWYRHGDGKVTVNAYTIDARLGETSIDGTCGSGYKEVRIRVGLVE